MIDDVRVYDRPLDAGEIRADMARPARMLRLLQGDVGSGKTIVALYAMLVAVAHGQPAALMAPTGILARQHAGTPAALRTSDPHDAITAVSSPSSANNRRAAW